ncbi:MAG TPA: cohesin domain-containing protein [Candidatus Polarisedimenticolaceae bacterium]|nr:cohesin domain-containing protein [Candidatus Polarisedimenticolaceae bacterium]
MRNSTLRHISYILPVIAVIGLAVGFLSPAKPGYAANASVTAVSGSVTVGSNITTTISLNAGGNNVDTASINLTYNTAQLQCVSVNTSTDFNVAPGGDVCGGGTVHADRGRTANFTANGTLITVTFKALTAGSAPITVATSTNVYSAGTVLPTTRASGTITVSAPASPPPAPAPSPTPSPSPTPTPTPTPKPTPTPTPTPKPGSPAPSPAPTTPGSPSPAPAPAPNSAPTPATADDRVPPKISNVKVTSIEANKATVTWATNEPANSRVEYGLTTAYGLAAGDDALTTSHSVELSPQLLQKGLTFHVRAKSMDGAGNTAFSSDVAFQTSGFEVAIVVTDKDGKPVSGAEVTYGGVTKKTDSTGTVQFENVAYGKQNVDIKVGFATTKKSVEVGKTDASGNVVPQKFVLQAAQSDLPLPSITAALIVLFLGVAALVLFIVKRRMPFSFAHAGGSDDSFQTPVQPQATPPIPGLDHVNPEQPQPGAIYHPPEVNEPAPSSPPPEAFNSNDVNGPSDSNDSSATSTNSIPDSNEKS